MSSPHPQVNKSQNSQLKLEEEDWFADRGRDSKRMLRTSPTTPPPPIGDELADRWFR